MFSASRRNFFFVSMVLLILLVCDGMSAFHSGGFKTPMTLRLKPNPLIEGNVAELDIDVNGQIEWLVSDEQVGGLSPLLTKNPAGKIPQSARKITRRPSASHSILLCCFVTMKTLLGSSSMHPHTAVYPARPPARPLA